MGIFRKLVGGTVVTTLILGGGAGVVYKRRLAENASCTAEVFNAKQAPYDMNIAMGSVESFAKSGGKQLPVPIKLYRYTTCPFCSKVKAYLDYNKIPHECVEVEPMLKAEIAQSSYKKVPQLQFITSGHTGPWLVDSDVIVETLAKKVGQGNQVDDPEIKKWRGWARESLVRLLVVNINTSLVEAWKGYEYIDRFDTIPQMNKYFLKVMGAPVMWMVAKYKTGPTLLKNGDLKEGEDARTVLLQQIDRFVLEALPPAKDEKVFVKKGKEKKVEGPFHGGAKPDLADLDVYGVLQSIRGHRVYDDVIKSTTIGPWLEAMDAATGK